MAQASLSSGSRSHLLHASRGTCTSMYIALAMTGIFGLSKRHSGLPPIPPVLNSEYDQNPCI